MPPSVVEILVNFLWKLLDGFLEVLFFLIAAYAFIVSFLVVISVYLVVVIIASPLLLYEYLTRGRSQGAFS